MNKPPDWHQRTPEQQTEWLAAEERRRRHAVAPHAPPATESGSAEPPAIADTAGQAGDAAELPQLGTSAQESPPPPAEPPPALPDAPGDIPAPPQSLGDLGDTSTEDPGSQRPPGGYGGKSKRSRL